MFTTLLKPRKPIPDDATRVNGITDEMVQNAPAFAQIKSALEAFVGDEVEQGYDWEKDKNTLEIGYGAICNTPKSVQDFFDEHSGDYRLFVLDAYEDDNGRVKVKIGVYPEK